MCSYLGFQSFEQLILVSHTTAQSGKLALCHLLGTLLCQEGCIRYQVRALTTLSTHQEADSDSPAQMLHLITS